ncbi:anthranilate synthase component I [[Clostridium] symbiosum]|uniref:anthranilate synthase component I n=1 Tax=Clostridium symbiosum TaxID=1512 RepID=UPI001D084C80|nr:anthranilate synthase component I [[Clostridium] symbiosum]MCB6610801.1 anthranilate synthase component I [[Clostridium] symbiosum]MCB6930968.1 anthranilate synthase component I [[Clostridium] symbiosum]
MYPTLEDLKKIAEGGSYRRIPVAREVYSDRFTPVEVMRTLRAASRHCYLLESAEDNQKWGRYSFLGYSPSLELTCKNGVLRVRRGEEDELTEETTTGTIHPGEAIRRILDDYKSPKLENMPPFTGGLVGYFSYDYIKYAEPSLNTNGLKNDDFCDVDLMLFDRVIVFDHYKQKLILIAGVDPSDPDHSYQNASEKLDEIEKLLGSEAKAVFKPLKLKEELTPAFSKKEYCRMVEKARHYIHEGDIFQVVLSDPLTAAAEGSLFDTYRVLRTTNPSPYMFYFSSDDVEIAGASPETLAKLENETLFNFPLAGTRPRGRDAVEDQALERELLSDTKELAEHNMLVDLGRNDLGKVCSLGTVNVLKYCTIERFSHVMHIGSTVSGTIRKDKDAVDAIDSILPAGTLSGAPKLRACEIIGELEGRKRGIYGGAIGYLDFTGNMDTCIAIRLAYKKNGRVCVQSGAGIVADSVPEREFEECCNKAKAVVNALKAAEGGLL